MCMCIYKHLELEFARYVVTISLLLAALGGNSSFTSARSQSWKEGSKDLRVFRCKAHWLGTESGRIIEKFRIGSSPGDQSV